MFNVETNVGRIYYLQGRAEVFAAIVHNKLLMRLTMKGRCVGNVVGAKEMAVYVCWGDIRRWDDELCGWEYD